MADEIRGDVEVNFTGNVNKDLTALIKNLEKAESVALEAAGAFDKMNHKARANELRTAASAVSAYRKEVERLSKAMAKVPATEAPLGIRGDLTGTQQARDLRNRALLSLDAQQQAEWEKNLKKKVSLEENLTKEREKSSAKALRIQQAEDAMVQQDLKNIQKRLDKKRRAAQEEIALAQRVAKAEAEAAAKARQAETTSVNNLRSEQNIQTGIAANKAYWAEQEAAIRKNSAAVKATFRDQEAYINSLSNTRYALYDVSRTATIAAVALTAVFAAPLVKFAQYEQQFASVARTVGLVGDEINNVRDDFVDLSTEIPRSFDELSQIGTLGGQLGISADSIEKFTEVVAKFAATTNVTVATAAEEIGRTAQLTQTAGSEYENLASSIYQVGVTSVATEGQILEMMSQISTAGNLAGLANTDIVALAGALASLGIQPEAARGSLQRLFNLIENGATTATDYTAQLAEITGMTADEMQRLWKDGMGGSQEVFSSFITGLGRMQDAGENTTNVLREMGVYQVRDQRLLQVLANNTEVYAKALDESNAAYASGTALAEGYAKQTDNLASNFQLLLNTVSGLMAELGEGAGGPLNEVLKGFVSFSQGLLELSRNPVVKWLAAFAAGVAVVGAAITGYIALTARMQAMVFGMITAQDGLSKAHVNASFNLRNLTSQMVQAALAFRAGSGSGMQFATSLEAVGAASGTAAAGLNTATGAAARMGVATRGVAVGARIAGSALAAMSKAGAILFAISLAVEGLTWVMREFSSEADKAREFWASADNSGLSEALKADTEAYEATGDALRIIPRAQAEAEASTNSWSTTLQDLAADQRTARLAIDETTSAVERQGVAIGNQTLRDIAKEFASNDAMIKAWQETGNELELAGFKLDEFYRKIAQGGGAAEAYIQEFQRKIGEAYQAGNTENALGLSPAQVVRAMQALDVLTDASATFETRIQAAATASELFSVGMQAMGEDTEGAAESIQIAGREFENLKSYVDSITDSVSGPYELEKAFRDLGMAIAENGATFSQFREEGQKNIGAVLDIVGQLEQASGGDQTAFGENILGLMAALQAEGINTGEELSFLGQILQDTLGGTYNLDFNSSAAQQSIIAVIEKAIAAQRALVALRLTAMQNASKAGNIQYAEATAAYNEAVGVLTGLESIRTKAVESSGRAHQELTKEVNKGTKANNSNAQSAKKAARSILDWVDDLRQVMNTADELRFGVQDAWDKILEAQKNAVKSLLSSSYDIGAALEKAVLASQHSDNLVSMLYSMQDAAEDAAKAVIDATNDIQSALAELQGITSERSQLEYGLNVAMMYGDLLRAEAIRAKIAELDAKQAKTQADLVESQNDLADAIESQNKSLTGNSKQAIKNRATVRNLAEEYIDWINQLVEGGASTSELAAAVEQAKQDFIDQAVAMGFSRDQLNQYIAVFAKGTQNTEEGADAVRDLYEAWQEYILQLIQSGASQDKINRAIAQGKAEVKALATQMGLAPKQVQDYVKAFDGVKLIVDKIPKDINVKLGADLDPAEKAIRDWKAKNSGGKGLSSGVNIPVTTSIASADKRAMEKLRLQSLYLGYAKAYSKTGSEAAKNNMQYYYDRWKNYWEGGYTGPGGKHQPAGIVHKGEYVVPREEVNQRTKLPYFMERIAPVTNNNMSFPSVIMVELSPTDRALIASNGGSVVMLDGREIAKAVNNQNRLSSMRGSA